MRACVALCVIACALGCGEAPSLDDKSNPATCNDVGSVGPTNGCEMNWLCTSDDKDVDLRIVCDTGGDCTCIESGTEGDTFHNEAMCEKLQTTADTPDFRDGVARTGCGWFLQTPSEGSGS